MSLLQAMRKLPSRVTELVRTPNQVRELRDLILFQQTKELQASHPNPLNHYGRKCFSQSDEDGITLEILRRLGKLEGGVFAEFGVGDGTENNTLLLAALGWKGFWVGGEKLRFSLATRDAPRVTYLREWITLDNVVALAQKGLQEVGASVIDVVSLDLDGNDIYFVEKLLASGLKPALFIVEYNAKFPPPVPFQIVYDPHHTWQGDDYFGASLTSFDRLFARFGFQLVCCNSHSGANAFFVDAAYATAFADVPKDIGQIYVEPRYQLYSRYGHTPSMRTIETIINRG
jgi:hypothetical protein